MRAAILVVVAAGCAPEIAPGAYLCGPEQLCPDDLACNGPDGVCVVPATVQPFACGPRNNDVPGDDTPATGQDLGDFTCVSLVRETRSCLPEGDVGDFYTFQVAAGCTNARVQAAVVYPIAFQRVVLQLGKQGETPVTIDTECSSSRGAAAGDDVSCLEAAVEPGTYTLGVVADGTGDCDGACRYNRYGLAVQVTTQ